MKSGAAAISEVKEGDLRVGEGLPEGSLTTNGGVDVIRRV